MEKAPLADNKNKNNNSSNSTMYNMKKKTSEAPLDIRALPPEFNIITEENDPRTAHRYGVASNMDPDGGLGSGRASPRVLSRDMVPDLMRKNSNKRILNQRSMNHPTKMLRMKSLLWTKPTISKQDLSNSVTSQLFPTLIVNFAALSAGLSFGYSAIALPQLKPYMDHHSDTKDTTSSSAWIYRPFTIDDEMGSWIASIYGIGAIFGGFASAILGSRFGRRKSLLILAFPDIFGWVLIASAQNVAMMLAGRFFCGFASAGYAPAVQIFVAEIAQPHQRGWLSAITVPTIGLGSLLAYSLGALISWHWVAVIAISFPVLLIPGLMFLPDSPYWYMQNGQEKKALKVMERFRSSNANCLAELLAIADSLKRPEDSQDWSYRDLFQQLMQRQYRRPFLLLNFLFLLMTFSGKYAISFYAVEIFHMASEGINEYASAIVIGFIKLCGCILYIPAMKYFSRRTLLCCSSLVMGTALSILGLAVYSHHHPEDHSIDHTSLHHIMEHIYWLPLLCVTIFMIADPIGLGSIPFLYSAEFYPSEMRSLLGGVTIGLSNLEMFLVVKTFPNMNHMMGSHGTFWLYAGVCFVAIIFTLFFIPETKGLTLQEIEGHFSHKENLHVTPYVTPSATPASIKRGIAPYPHLSLQFTL